MSIPQSDFKNITKYVFDEHNNFIGIACAGFQFKKIGNKQVKKCFYGYNFSYPNFSFSETDKIIKTCDTDINKFLNNLAMNLKAELEQ